MYHCIYMVLQARAAEKGGQLDLLSWPGLEGPKLDPGGENDLDFI